MTQVETSMARTEVRPFSIDVPEEKLVDDEHGGLCVSSVLGI